MRALLWEAGCTVSNKVLECLVLRFAKNRILTTENYVMALVRLHLSHERYHNIDTKMKSNPLSLEEVSNILVFFINIANTSFSDDFDDYLFMISFLVMCLEAKEFF